MRRKTRGKNSPKSEKKIKGDVTFSGPGPDGVLNSIRAENWREGIEDYEYLYLLRQWRQRAGQAAPQAAREADRLLREVSDMRPYGRHFSQPPTTDPSWIFDRRRRMARVIESLQASAGSRSAKVKPSAARKTAENGKERTPRGP